MLQNFWLILLYQWQFSLIIIIIIIIIITMRTWKYEEERRPSKLQHYWDQPEYWEESWRLEETCCQSNSIDRNHQLTLGWKTQKGVNNNDNLLLSYFFSLLLIFLCQELIKQLFHLLITQNLFSVTIKLDAMSYTNNN